MARQDLRLVGAMVVRHMKTELQFQGTGRMSEERRCSFELGPSYFYSRRTRWHLCKLPLSMHRAKPLGRYLDVRLSMYRSQLGQLP